MTEPATTVPLLLAPAAAARHVGLSRGAFYRTLKIDPDLLRCRRRVPGERIPRFSTKALDAWVDRIRG